MKNFTTYKLAIQTAERLADVLEQLRARDNDLFKQLRKAMASVVLNLAEGSRRRGQDRLHLFRIASGSAAEVYAGTELAKAWRYVDANCAVAAIESLDHLLAMLWKLTEK